MASIKLVRVSAVKAFFVKNESHGWSQAQIFQRVALDINPSALFAVEDVFCCLIFEGENHFFYLPSDTLGFVVTLPRLRTK